MQSITSTINGITYETIFSPALQGTRASTTAYTEDHNIEYLGGTRDTLYIDYSRPEIHVQELQALRAPLTEEWYEAYWAEQDYYYEEE